MSSGGPGSALYKSTDGGETWTDITHVGGPARRASTARSASRSRPSIRIACSRSSRTRTAGCSARTTPARRGRSSTTSGASASARSTTRTSSPTRRTRTSSTSRTSARSARRDGGKTFAQQQFARGDSHDMWIDPDDNNHVLHAADPGGDITFNAHGANCRRGRSVDYPTGQFYHVVATPRDAVLRLRLAAGRERDVRADAAPAFGGRGGGGGGRGGAPARVQPRRLGGRLHRARSARPGHLLLRHERERRRFSHEAQSPHRRSRAR